MCQCQSPQGKPLNGEHVARVCLYATQAALTVVLVEEAEVLKTGGPQGERGRGVEWLRFYCNNLSIGPATLTEPAMNQDCRGWTLSCGLDETRVRG